MTDQQRKGVSWDPETFVTGGLLDDVDVTFKNVRVEMFDYEGKSDPAPALGADLVTGAEGEGEKPIRQHWSIGSAENWAPSPDGMEIIPIGKDTAPRKASNFFFLVQSLKQAGVPGAVIQSGRADALEGLKAHVRRVDGPKRSNLPSGGQRRGADGKIYEKENKILCVEKIYEPYPWDAPKKGATKKSAPKAAAGGDKSAVTDKTKTVMMALIAQGEGKTSKKEIPTKGFLKIKEVFGQNDADLNDILGNMFKDAWLTENGFAVAADGTITVA